MQTTYGTGIVDLKKKIKSILGSVIKKNDVTIQGVFAIFMKIDFFFNFKGLFSS